MSVDFASVKVVIKESYYYYYYPSDILRCLYGARSRSLPRYINVEPLVSS